MKRTLSGMADTRPVVLVSHRVKDHDDAKNLSAYFRVKHSNELVPDYVFPGIRRVGSLAAITIDLKKWDRAVDLLDEIGNLQKQEGDFLQRLWQMYSSFRTTIAVFIIDREASRRRFMGIQERILEHSLKLGGPVSKLMILPVDNPHGIANELAEIRCVTTMGLPDCSKAIPVRNWGKPHCRQYIKAARDF